MLLAFVKDKWPILAVCLIFGGRQYSKHMTGVAVRSVTPAQELVTLKKHAMSEHQLSSLRSHLEAALPSLEGQYLGRGFANTRGFVLKFNTQGAAKLRDPDFMNGTYSFLSPFFETFRDPAANAFVLNALVVPAGGSADEARDPAVGLHVDNTVGIDSVRLFLAHSVSVLYVTVPDGMEGGQLKLWSYSNKPESAAELAAPEGSVSPEEGMLAVFRGDSYHLVDSWRLREGGGGGGGEAACGAEGAG
mmetsp:Transcript_7744/g.24490  ORF Transcript_7744/g.24490 Transcript_7744/m.24490 type:complete len:247 (-) Transcript_7744:46-786(-)